MLKLSNAIALATLVWALGGHATAHTDEYLDSQPAPHGGQVRMTDLYHLELVLAGDTLTVYVMDHGNQPLPSAGMQGTATVLTGEQKVEVKLEPAGDNLLQGKGDFKTAPDTKVLVTVIPAPQTARFTPLQKSKAAADTPSAPQQDKDNKDKHGGHRH